MGWGNPHICKLYDDWTGKYLFEFPNLEIILDDKETLNNWTSI